MVNISKDKNIYIKNVKNINGYDVWLIDGSYIRKNINENFVEYDHHFNHSFIPKNELWIDNETNPEERKFFIDHMLAELNLIKEGGGIKEATKKADILEKQERTAELKKNRLYEFKNNYEKLLSMARKKLLKEYGTNKIKIYLVDGKMVRNFFFVEYAEGGHDKVYDFIPENEIWIDEILSPKEIKFIIFHELRERNFMLKGENYKEAHKRATLAEDYYRDHPELLDDKIKAEING